MAKPSSGRDHGRRQRTGTSAIVTAAPHKRRMRWYPHISPALGSPFYTNIFDNSRIVNVARDTAANPDIGATAMRAMFEMKKIVIDDIERAVKGR